MFAENFFIIDFSLSGFMECHQNVVRILFDNKKEAKRVSNSGSLPTSDPESETCILPTRVFSSCFSLYILLSRFFEHASDFQQNVIKSIFNSNID